MNETVDIYDLRRCQSSASSVFQKTPSPPPPPPPPPPPLPLPPPLVKIKGAFELTHVCKHCDGALEMLREPHNVLRV